MDKNTFIAERDSRSMRDEEARRGDILIINKERERYREKGNWVLEVRKSSDDDNIRVIIFAERADRWMPGSI